MLADPDVEIYFAQASRKSRLTHEEATGLAWRIRVHGDPWARKRLVEGNLFLVVHFAREFRNRGLPFIDLILEGNEGLLKAADKFDPAVGVRFSTYAKWWIRDSLQRAVQKKARTVHVPAAYQKLAAKGRRARRELPDDATPRDVAARLGVDEGRLRHAAAVAGASTQPIDPDDPSAIERRDAVEQLLGEREAVAMHALLERLPSALSCLPPEESRLLRLAFGLDNGNPLGFDRAARAMGLSAARARWVRGAAVSALRGALGA